MCRFSNKKINLSLKEMDTMYQKTYVAFYKSCR
jgi:hypothetical protein